MARSGFLWLWGALALGCGGGGTGAPYDAGPDVLFVSRDASADDVAVLDDNVVAPDDVAVTPPDDAGPALPPPLTAPADQWTWVPIPGMRCANGTPTGIGVNLHPGSNNVLLFLQGGGACWDGATCWGPVSTSFYIATGYDQTAFATDVPRPAMLALRRDDPSNPFGDYNMVYVPYCTGDVHAGNAVRLLSYLGTDHVTHFVGAANLDALLPYVRATFPSPDHFWLSGDSAGGFGSALNLPRVRQALPGVRVNVLDDSGQPIQPDPARWALWRDAWDLQVPADCTDCRDHVGSMVDYIRTHYADTHYALLSYGNDSVISTFMNLDTFTFSNRLGALASQIDAEWPNGRYFIAPGALHVLLLTQPLGLAPWLRRLVNEDPTLRSVRP